jgi:hypothetical protein
MAVPVMADQTYVKGETWTLGLKDMNFGTYYVKETHEFNLGAQLSILSWKELLSLNWGFLTADAKNFPMIGGVGLNINTLAKIFHLEYHLPGDLQLGVFIGRDFKKNYQEGKFWGMSGNVVWDFSK